MALAHRGIAMNSDDKLLAIVLAAVFLGGVGSKFAGWPALLFAALAISAICFAKGED